MENLKNRLEELYGTDNNIIEYQEVRYKRIIGLYSQKFNISEYNIFSSPGRTEIGGNHTDHNLGNVLAGSINLDSIAVASRTNNNIVTLFSEGYNNPFIVDLENLKIIEEENETTNSLIRGIAFRIKEMGLKIGGFNAVITSDVFQGSGLSSSASIEVLISTTFNHLYNKSKIDSVEIAKISQYAENKYFGKPCGLMDQMACSVGGIIKIDFENPIDPLIKKMEVDFNSFGYNLVIVNTGGNHVDLTDDYAAIPYEMKKVANIFNKDVLRKLDYDTILNHAKFIRTEIGDRALLRALHFYNENERVQNQIIALENKNIVDFIKLFNDSGNSSFRWLQNIYSNKNIQEQPISIGLAFTKEFFTANNVLGGARIHGGGFAGTILALVPTALFEEYVGNMERIFEKDCVIELSIRNKGCCKVI